MATNSRWTTCIPQRSMMHLPGTLSRLGGTESVRREPNVATLRPSVLRVKMPTLSGSFSSPTGLLQRRECSLTSRLLCSGQRAEESALPESQRRRVEASQITRKEKTQKRHQAQRKKGQEGTQERPRLAVFRSNNHIYAQVIDDTVGHTLAAVSSLTPTVRQSLASKVGANKEAAEAVGKKIAELCLSKNIEKVFLDRGGFQYHGRIEAFAQAAREGGLSF